MISVHFQGKPFSITVIQVYAPTSNAEEAEVERFYEDLQDLLELTPKKDGSSLGNVNENYFTSITRSIIKIPPKQQVLEMIWETGTLGHYWSELEMVQSLWKLIW